MSPLVWLRSLWAGIVPRNSVRRELDEELRAHIALRAARVDPMQALRAE
jgi:hypothetical protein